MFICQYKRHFLIISRLQQHKLNSKITIINELRDIFKLSQFRCQFTTKTKPPAKQNGFVLVLNGGAKVAKFELFILYKRVDRRTQKVGYSLTFRTLYAF